MANPERPAPFLGGPDSLPARALRFCMLTTFYPPYSFGGDAIFVQQLAHELARRGHHVEVIHCTDAYRALAGKEPEHDEPDVPGVTVHHLRSPFGVLSPLATHQTGWPLFKSARIRQVLARGFDVIHYHNPSLIGPGVLGYGAAPVKLYTLHEYWLLCPTHMLFKYDRTPCVRRHCVACTLAHRRPPQLWRYSPMLRRALRHVDVFLAASRFARSKHLEMGFKAPIAELPYFTSHKPAAGPGPETPPPGLPYFLFAGRLARLKGLQTLIPVFRRYERARLLVAGTGPHEASLRRQAAGVANIVFLGHQPVEQLGRLYAGAVALIVPSLWYEVFGLVIIEAFAQRTPAIVRNIGGMPQIMAESGGGFVYETEAELLTAMDRLLTDSDLRATLGNRGHEAMQRRWSADTHIARYLGLIEEVAGARRG